MSLWGKAPDVGPRALLPEPAGNAPDATADPREPSVAAPARALPAASAGEAAWLAAIPCALLTLAAVVLLGPALGRALFTPGPVHFLAKGIVPEPTEHARFLLAVIAPVALAGFVIAGGARLVGPVAGRRHAARAAEWALLAFVALALVALRVWTYSGTEEVGYQFRVYFTIATIVAAVALAAALAATLRSEALVERLRALTRETRARRVAALLLAVVFSVAWLLTAFNTEGSIGLADIAVQGNIPYWLDETFAVLDGAIPLAGFHAQYAQLWPYVTAGAMAFLGTTFAVYAGVMVAASVATMVAVYATLRRVVGSSLLALGLWAPFVATSFFKERGSLENRYGPSNLFSLFPIRYGGPYVLAWLLARRLGGARPRSAALLFLLAGLVVVNNPEFGVPAFAATVATLLLTLPGGPSWRAGARLLAQAALGLAGALAAVALVTLIAAGSLPHYGQLTEFSRIYGLDGFGMLPMPGFGFHYAIYVTFAGALALAAVRTVEGREDVVLTGLLCWVGVFGLGAGGYYAGRSHPEVLIDVFSPWALALALLLVAAVRAIRARPSRLPTAAEIAVLGGFGLAVCSIAQTPTPWSQVERVRQTTEAAYRPTAAERFVRAHTHPGERVMIAADLGHRIAYDVGVKDIFPYAHMGSMPTNEQWLLTIRTARREHVRSFFVPTPFILGVLHELRAAGYRIGAADRERAQIVQLVR